MPDSPSATSADGWRAAAGSEHKDSVLPLELAEQVALKGLPLRGTNFQDSRKASHILLGHHRKPDDKD